ncbi:MAG TPA: DUF4340 domain-containing protein [Candidatus Saccharimonadales bacterium]|nr:DUF4340 domain-containing protein [Candidatus Saccharimonadales bacterium]
MKPKNTFIWLVIAAVLFAFIFIFNHFLRPVVVAPSAILSGLNPSTVISIQVIPPNALEIQADRTNGTWLLAKPIAYPAQSAAIETLLAALQKLTPAIRISAGELRQQQGTEADYGFDPPRTSIVIEEAGGQRWQLQVGNKTAPGDQVFLRLVGTDGAFVTDAGWLKYIPQSVNDWRDTALVDFSDGMPDWIVLTNGAKVIELRLNATNHLWQMIRPLVARADSSRITEALQRLQMARVSQFITDDPKADLTSFDLQPADLDLWLGRGTNFVAGLYIGKNPTNDTSLVYAEREGWNTVVTTAKEPLAPWFGTVNDFRDPYLFDLSTPVAEIEVHGNNNFTLQRQGTNGWRVVGESFPADAESVQQFIQMLAGLHVAEFVKDVVTTPDLPAYGLATPKRQITLLSAVGDTNSVIAQLMFGATQTNEVFVRRADEDSVYAIPLEEFNQLPDAGWELRERQIWNFSEADVAKIIIHQNGKTRQVIHNGLDQWSLAPGSQGIIVPAAIEETAHRFGELTAAAWLARNVTDPEKFGLKPGNLSITLELKNGVEHTVDFGTPAAQTALAAVTLDGERWAFVFPPVLYQFVLSYLTIPANVP